MERHGGDCGCVQPGAIGRAKLLRGSQLPDSFNAQWRNFTTEDMTWALPFSWHFPGHDAKLENELSGQNFFLKGDTFEFLRGLASPAKFFLSKFDQAPILPERH